MSSMLILRWRFAFPEAGRHAAAQRYEYPQKHGPLTPGHGQQYVDQGEEGVAENEGDEEGFTRDIEQRFPSW
ncbi:hypothetical protein [Streptomyces sp. NRRL F-5135]|uniref:hypothetical protein n=1 Tax=Streptomyces sp. NRRL F-5135 TaxID=1463858 RepID=UPI00131D9FB9|nr:hypothetical protein [Streptomyces sp. NRRL F-5135]